MGNLTSLRHHLRHQKRSEERMGQAFVQGVGWLALMRVTTYCSVNVWEDHRMCHVFIIPLAYLDFWFQETDLKSDRVFVDCQL